MESAIDDPLDVLLRRSWHAVATVDDVGTGPLSVTLLDRALVLVRLDEAISAFDDQCPHRGAALSLGWVSGSCLVCPYHGWHYGSDGACVRIPSLDDGGRAPSRAHLRSYPVSVHLGLVWVALEDPVLGLPEFAELTDPDMHVVACPPYSWDCHATRRLENFLDFAHFPWIHPGILGDPTHPLVPAHTVAQQGQEIHVHQTRIEPANDDVKTGGLGIGDTVTSEMDYRVQLPLTAQLHQLLPGGRRYAVWLTVSPVGAARARTFWFVARNYALDDDDEKFVRFQQDVVAQDRPIIESQRPRRIPFALSDELHVRDDKVVLAYRRALLEYAQS
jgi:phenylpropionate dioxygenase-like ring-hydroxylating dioxygenase large terminal subunit